MSNDLIETVLTEASRPSEVLKCAINAIEQLSDNEYIYDDENYTNIEIKDARKVVEKLRGVELIMESFNQWMLDGRLSIKGITDDEVKEILR